MTSADFEVELQKLDSRLTIVPNPDRIGLANIFFEGKNYDLPVISAVDIRDEPDPAYQYEFPNGMRARYWSKPEIVARVEDFLTKVDGNRELYKDEK